MLVPIMVQGDNYSCGPTCAIMVCAYYQGNIPSWTREQIRSLCLGGHGVTNQKRLIKALREQGLTVGIRRNMCIEEYQKAFYYQRPVIVYHIENEHWMVALAEKKGLLVCNDPESTIQEHYSLDVLSSTGLIVGSKK